MTWMPATRPYSRKPTLRPTGGGRAGWALEFLSPQGVCDPLPPGGTIESGVLSALGFDGGVENATLSRLHVRGAAAEID